MKRKQLRPFVLAVSCLLAIHGIPTRSVAQAFPGSIPTIQENMSEEQRRLNRNLIEAVKNNDTKAVISLLNQGADANCREETFMMVDWSSPAREVKYKPAFAPTPLILALKIRVLPDHTLAIPPENLPLIQALLDHKADVNTSDGGWQGPTPLFYAMNLMSGPYNLKRKATLHLLIKNGADLKPIRYNVETPPRIRRGKDYPTMIKAALVNVTEYLLPDCMDVLAEMLKRGADVNQQNGNRETALWIASFDNDVDTVRLLLSYHADVTLRRRGGETALSAAKSVVFDAAKSRQIVKLLRQAGAKK